MKLHRNLEYAFLVCESGVACTCAPLMVIQVISQHCHITIPMHANDSGDKQASRQRDEAHRLTVLRLLLGTEALITAPDGVVFSFISLLLFTHLQTMKTQSQVRL